MIDTPAQPQPKKRVKKTWRLGANELEAIEDQVQKSLKKAMESPAVKVVNEIELVQPSQPETDIEQIFELFAIYCGDVERTALACGQPKEKIEDYSVRLGWKDKLKVLIDLRTSARPGDSERGINRAINFVQAHRLRRVIESVIAKLSSLASRDLEALCFSTEVDKRGNVSRKIVTRPFADLASALEKCHAATYAALNDTASDRRDRKEEPTNERTQAELHLQISKAMQEAAKLPAA